MRQSARLPCLVIARPARPQSLLGKAVRNALNQWADLEVCMRDGRVEIDTNLAENAIRPAKLGAENWIFLGRETAGERGLSSTLSWRTAGGTDPRDYLENMLNRLPSIKAGRPASFPPANWLKTRQQFGRRAARAATCQN